MVKSERPRTFCREFQFEARADARVEHRTDAITITTRYYFKQAKEDIKIVVYLYAPDEHPINITLTWC